MGVAARRGKALRRGRGMTTETTMRGKLPPCRVTRWSYAFGAFLPYKSKCRVLEYSFTEQGLQGPLRTTGHVPGDAGETFFCELAVLRFELDAQVAAFEKGSGDKGTIGTCEGVEDYVARSGESFNERVEDADRLFGGMHFVAGIFPRLNVVERSGRLCGAAFGEDVGLLVTGTEEAGT